MRRAESTCGTDLAKTKRLWLFLGALLSAYGATCRVAGPVKGAPLIEVESGRSLEVALVCRRTSTCVWLWLLERESLSGSLDDVTHRHLRPSAKYYYLLASHRHN